MEQIIIDGVNLTDLKVEYDALAAKQSDMRKSIRQGSSAFIADQLKQVGALITEMKEAEDLATAEVAAEKATTILKNIQFVSNVSGVSYMLDYYNYHHDYVEGEPITSILEDGDYDVLCSDEGSESKILSALYSIAESMESDVREWNTSYC